MNPVDDEFRSRWIFAKYGAGGFPISLLGADLDAYPVGCGRWPDCGLNWLWTLVGLLSSNFTLGKSVRWTRVEGNVTGTTLALAGSWGQSFDLISG